MRWYEALEEFKKEQKLHYGSIKLELNVQADQIKGWTIDLGGVKHTFREANSNQ